MSLISIVNNKLKGYISSNLLRDSAWSIIGSVFGKMSSLAGLMLIAKMIGNENFGAFGAIRNVLLSLGMFSTLGLGYASTKLIAEIIKEDINQASQIAVGSIVITLLSSCFMCVLLLILSEDIASSIFGAHISQGQFRLMLVWYVLNSVTITQNGILFGYSEFKQVAKISSISGILFFCLTIVLTFNFGLIGTIYSLVIVQIISAGLCVQSVGKHVSVFKFNVEQFLTFQISGVMKNSIPVALQEGVYAITSWMSVYLVVKYASIGDVGIYTVATQWTAVVLFIPGILRSVMLAHFSGLANQLDEQVLLLRRFIKINFLATVVSVLVMGAFSGAISNFYGSDFSGLRIILLVCLIGTVFQSVSNGYVQFLISNDDYWFVLISMIFRDATLLLGAMAGYEFVLCGTGALPFAIGSATSSMLFIAVLHMRISTRYEINHKRKLMPEELI